MPRVTQKRFTIPGTEIVIEKGTKIEIAVHAIHNDPDLYPNPENFDPSRFEKENKKNRHEMAWLAFGAGYRDWYANYLLKLLKK